MTLLAHDRQRTRRAASAASTPSSSSSSRPRPTPSSSPSSGREEKPAVRPFRFKYLDEDGNADGLLSSSGEVRDEVLVLGLDHEVRLSDVARVVVRANRLGLSVMVGGGRAEGLDLLVTSGPRGGRDEAEALKRRIDRVVSARRAAWRHRALRAEGRGLLFRASACGHCGATVDLTGFAETPTIYCSYCDALSTPGDLRALADVEQAPRRGHGHRCDSCGYFGHPEPFVTQVPVFVRTGAYWATRRRDLCRSCTRKEGWKAVCQTAPTLYGAPTALFRLARACLGGSGSVEGFHAGRPEAAESLYGAVLAKTSQIAGVHFNRALSRSAVGDWSGCLDAVKSAWSECSNYTPALALASKALKALGRGAEAEALAARWAAAHPGRKELLADLAARV